MIITSSRFAPTACACSWRYQLAVVGGNLQLHMHVNCLAEQVLLVELVNLFDMYFIIRTAACNATLQQCVHLDAYNCICKSDQKFVFPESRHDQRPGPLRLGFLEVGSY